MLTVVEVIPFQDNWDLFSAGATSLSLSSSSDPLFACAGYVAQAQISPADPFLKYGKAVFFICVESGKVLARMSCSFDPRATESSTAFFGHFDALDRIDAVQMLFSAATKWAKGQGKTKIAGPVDFSIWHNYRFLTSGFEAHPFVGEPRSPRIFHELVERCGLNAANSWRSYDFTSDLFGVMLKSAQGNCDKHGDELSQYSFQPFDLSQFQNELHQIHPMFMDTFSQNSQFSQLSLPEFEMLFGPLGALLCASSSRKVYSSTQELVAFSLIFKNPLMPGSAILHSFGIKANHRKGGIAHMLFACAWQGCIAEKYSLAIGALAKQGRNFYEKTLPAARVYQVYEREI